MINELYELSKALEQANVSVPSWHRKYKPLPNINAKAPCIRIVIEDGHVVSLSTVTKDVGSNLRRFGDNQGFYPGMNLAPLYRIVDDSVKKVIKDMTPERIDKQALEQFQGFCSDNNNNWSKKLQDKYNVSMTKRPKDIKTLLGQQSYAPLDMLMAETSLFPDSMSLHEELKNCAFRMLSEKQNIQLALTVLFYFTSETKDATEDFGSLSVIFDTPKLLSQGMSVATTRFTTELNHALLSADDSERSNQEGSAIVDAFSIPFEPIEEPMPDVKLAGGFDVKLRTMFKEKPCQYRYGRIGSASYPLSPENRKKLQAALTWLGGSPEQKDVTWTNTDKNEILFVYPFNRLQSKSGLTGMFKRPADGTKSFQERSKLFLTEIKQGKEQDTDSRARNICIFILRKIDKGRTKVIYTRQTDPYELEKCCEDWITGCSDNLPKFPFGQPKTPFPLDVADILNCFRKQDGTVTTNKYKPTPKYHGMEILFDPYLSIQTDLHTLVQNGINLGALLGKMVATDGQSALIDDKVSGQLALMGLLLYRANIRKETYMDSYPYLYGQLLKVSDELHLLYCKVVRKGDIPAQLVGGTHFQAATEAPLRTLNVLGQRMNPYILWAKSYRYQEMQEEGKESWRAAWLLSLYERIATQLSQTWSSHTILTNEEKAQLFIGYLAAFPKKETDVESVTTPENEEEENHA